MTSAESVGFDLLALGAFVQLALRWPVLPQRKQIGAARVFPANRSGLPHDGRGGGGGAQVRHHRRRGQPSLRHLVLQQQGAELTLIILRIIKVVWISFDIYPN